MTARSRRGLAVLGLIALCWATGPSAPATAATTPVQITTSVLPNGLLGSSFSVTLSASGGTPPYSWSLASGALPGGLLLSSLGTLQGIPGAAGISTIALRVTDAAGSTATRSLSFTAVAPPPPPELLVGISAAGTLASVGSPALTSPLPSVSAPVAAVSLTPSGTGLWTVTSTGQVTGVGVPSFGSVGANRLKGRIVAMAALPDGQGYFLLSSTGHVYGFGAARQHGSLKAKGSAAAIAVPADGRGYLVVERNGEVANFGGAPNNGSVAPRHRAAPIVGIATLPGGGYVLVSAAGRISRFGAAKDVALPSPRPASAVGIAAAPVGRGYFIVAGDGTLFPAGSARTLGSLRAAAPVVAIAAGA